METSILIILVGGGWYDSTTLVNLGLPIFGPQISVGVLPFPPLIGLLIDPK